MECKDAVREERLDIVELLCLYQRDGGYRMGCFVLVANWSCLSSEVQCLSFAWKGLCLG